VRIDAVIIAVILILLLWWMHQRTRNAIRKKRRAMYDDCLPLFTDIDITQDDVNYPVLRARYNSLEIVIEPLVDHIAVRKIPVLWLMVTLKSPVPYKSTLDYLVRPHNTEFYSPSTNLQHRLDVPQDWPQHATLRTNDVENTPPIDIVGCCVSRVFEDPKYKELLITPKGIRIVYLVDEALRSHYMVLRQLMFENDHLDNMLVKRLIDIFIQLHGDLSSNTEQLANNKVEND